MAAVSMQQVSSQQALLCEELRRFLESNQNPEHQQIQQIVSKVEEIKMRILVLSNDGKISSGGTFPMEKLVEVQNCLLELQTELGKAFSIHKAVSKRWESQKADEGYASELIQSVVKIILDEYRARWSNTNFKN